MTSTIRHIGPQGPSDAAISLALPPGRCVHGFQLQQHAAANLHGHPHPQRSSMVSKSLLSQRLLNREAFEEQLEPMHACSESEEGDATDDGCFFEDADTESWSWLPAEENSLQESDRSSLATASSAPVPIPAR